MVWTSNLDQASKKDPSLSAGWFKTLNILIDDVLPCIGDAAFAIYQVLDRHANRKTSLVRISVRRIAEKVRHGRRHVTRHLGKLKDAGLIEEVGRTAHGVTVYRLLEITGPTVPLLTLGRKHLGGDDSMGPVVGPTSPGGDDSMGPVVGPTSPPQPEQEAQDLENNSSNTPATTPATASRAEAEPGAAAAVFVSKGIQESQTTLRTATTPLPGMREPMADLDREGLVKELTDRKIPTITAERAVNNRGPVFVRAVLTFFDAYVKAGHARNPPGALRDMLTKPDKWGFVETASGWQEPPAIVAASPVESLKEQERRIDAEMLQRRREAEQARAERSKK